MEIRELEVGELEIGKLEVGNHVEHLHPRQLCSVLHSPVIKTKVVTSNQLKLLRHNEVADQASMQHYRSASNRYRIEKTENT